MIDVHPGRRRPVVGLHGQPVAAVAHRNTLGAVQDGQVVIGELPEHSMHLVAGQRFDGGYAAFVDQPVVVGQHRRPRISGVRTALRHLSTHRLDP